jgi:hypothetical protein
MQQAWPFSLAVDATSLAPRKVNADPVTDFLISRVGANSLFGAEVLARWASTPFKSFSRQAKIACGVGASPRYQNGIPFKRAARAFDSQESVS